MADRPDCRTIAVALAFAAIASRCWSGELAGEFSSDEVVQEGLAATHLTVGGEVTVRMEDGSEEVVEVRVPVWSKRGAIAVPEDRLSEFKELVLTMNEYADRARRVAEEGRRINRMWNAFFGSSSARQISSVDEVPAQ